MTGISPARPTPSNHVSRRQTAIGGVAVVIAFWWLATGVLLVAQRTVATRVVVLAAASIGAAVGLRLVYSNRRTETARGATMSFFGGALLWGWVAATLYGGWIVGIVTTTAVSPGSRLSLAGDAIAATIFNDVLGLLVFAAALYATRQHAVRTGAWTVLTFWCTHQLAKLNVFAGVEHPGEQFLPPYLHHLALYFGPPVNSPLLTISVIALVAASAWLALAAYRERRTWARWQSVLLASLIALAALEHILLGIGNGDALWQIFMARARS